MAKQNKHEKYFETWCIDCKRDVVKRVHGDSSGGTLECSELPCPAHRHINGMRLNADQVRRFVLKSGETKLKLIKR